MSGSEGSCVMCWIGIKRRVRYRLMDCLLPADAVIAERAFCKTLTGIGLRWERRRWGVSERIVTPEWIAIQRKYYEAGVFTPVTMRSLANILHALDEVERLQAAVERVRALHVGKQAFYPNWDGAVICQTCNKLFPCPTLRALEGTP